LEIADMPSMYVVKPMTFMNKSGKALKCIIEKLAADTEDILVIVDDFNLPLGSIRIRPSGSAGGHNGLQSVIDELGTENFARIRLGIGGQDEEDKVSYVLQKFSKKELKIVEEVLIDVKNAVECCINKGIEEAMNRFN